MCALFFNTLALDKCA